jgi:hypothetical protein
MIVTPALSFRNLTSHDDRRSEKVRSMSDIVNDLR